MNKHVEQVLQSLEKSNEVYAELLELSQKKRQMITAQNMEELDQLTTYEMGLVGTLYKLEEIRSRAVDELLKTPGFQPFSNITELANQLDAEDRRKMMDAKNKLLVGIKTVSEETRFNGKLLEDKLELIDLSIQMLTEETEDGYGNKQRKNILDVRI